MLLLIHSKRKLKFEFKWSLTGVIGEKCKIIFHWVFAFKNFSSYIIHALKNIRLWAVEKSSTLTSALQSNLFTSWRLIDMYSLHLLRVLHLLLERSQAYHQQFACCKMSATLQLLYLIAVKSGLNEKSTEWTDWQDERQQKVRVCRVLSASCWALKPKVYDPGTVSKLGSAWSYRENVQRRADVSLTVKKKIPKWSQQFVRSAYCYLFCHFPQSNFGDFYW